MIALKMELELQELFFYQPTVIYPDIHKVFIMVFIINLKAKRAELVDSGEADPNISRRERLSKEPNLSLIVKI